MIGTGGTALVSRILGEGDEKANHYFSMLIWLSLLIGIILAIFGVAFMRPVATLLGATKEMIDDCVLYGRVVIAFLAPYMLQNVFQSFLIAAEKLTLDWQQHLLPELQIWCLMQCWSVFFAGEFVEQHSQLV